MTNEEVFERAGERRKCKRKEEELDGTLVETVEGLGRRRYQVKDDVIGSGKYVRKAEEMERAATWKNLSEGKTPMMITVANYTNK